MYFVYITIRGVICYSCSRDTVNVQTNAKIVYVSTKCVYTSVDMLRSWGEQNRKSNCVYDASRHGTIVR